LFLAAAPLGLLVAGCAGGAGGGPQTTGGPPPGFSADTFGRAGLIGGAAATEAGCRALPDGLWVGAGDRRECLRHAAAGVAQPARTALVYLPGDPEGVAYRVAGGRLWVDGVGEGYESSPAARRAAAEALSGATGGMPVVLLARPGMHGSSGDHARDRHTQEEVALLDAALTRLRERHGFAEFALAGYSSGGLLAANLLARRADVRCAVMASAPLDLAAFHRGRDGTVPDHHATRSRELADPMRTVRAARPDATAFVLGDRHDRSVPAAAWEAWAVAAQRAGTQVVAADVAGPDGAGTHHRTAWLGLEAAYACAAGVPAERVRRALLAGEPLLAPRGRRLGGAEIAAAFAGGGLLALEWSHGAEAPGASGAGGELYRLRASWPGRGGAGWRVEGDRLCTVRHGCGEVLADGRFLHLIAGVPPRLAVTFAAAAPDG
jgi:pimeloyl-ACP methyl ester carboxylesterase